MTAASKIGREWKLLLCNGAVFVEQMGRHGSAFMRRLLSNRMQELVGLPVPSTDREYKQYQMRWQGLSSIVCAGVHVEQMGKHAARTEDVRELVERVCALPLPSNDAQKKKLKDALEEVRLDSSTLAFEGLAQRRLKRR
jgi:hypothetical protein